MCNRIKSALEKCKETASAMEGIRMIPIWMETERGKAIGEAWLRMREELSNIERLLAEEIQEAMRAELSSG